MPLLADRVRETTTTTGTGTIALDGPVTGFQAFNTAFANGATVYYVIQANAEWEIGIGTVGTGTLARTTVLQSSNGDALVPFSVGTKDVFVAYVADRAVTTSDASTLTNKTINDYTNIVGANHTHFRIKANEVIARGAVVKAVGYNPGEDAIEVVKTVAATDLALGVADSAMTTGQFGTATVIGEIENVNTNGFSVNQILYSAGSGGYTATKPASGPYQVLGWVVRANLNTGVIAVNVVAPLLVETSSNVANTTVTRDGSGNFAAGQVTAASLVVPGTTTLNGQAYTWPAAQTANFFLRTNGTGGLSWATLAETIALTDLSDVAISAATPGQPLVFNGTAWVNSSSLTASVTGNASTATTLQTARTINGVSFNGSADITVAAAAGTLTGTTLASNVTASSLTSVGTLANLTVTNPITGSVTGSSGSTTGNAATATALQTARNINGVSFNGTADITVAAAAGTLTGTTLASNVVSSSLTSVGTLSTLTVSGAITASGGTANSVAYLNGSKVLSTSANLTYDGTTLAIYNGTVDNQRLNISTSGTNVVLNATRTSGTVPQILFQIDGTERMRLSGTGNLGIGTLTPDSILHMASASTLNWKLQNTGAGGSTVASFAGVGAASLGTISNDPFFFFTNNVERARIDASGNFGIGSTPGYRLDVQFGAGSGNIFRAGQTAVSNGYTITTNGTALTHAWANAGANTMTLDTAGNLGLGVTPNASWGSNFRAMQYGTWGSVSRHGANGWMSVANNVYWDNSDVARYTGNFNATWYLQRLDGQHQWYTAPSGTAGNAITFTQAMALNGQANVNQLALSVNGASIYTNVRVTNSNSTAALSVGVGGSSVSAASLQNNAYVWNTAATALSFGTSDVERARIDSAGNLGLGVTPSAWSAGWKALQVGNWGAIGAENSTTGEFSLLQNAYGSAATSYVYRATSAASRYTQVNGIHSWFTAPSGTAGNAISFTQAMTLTASGNLGIGTPTPSSALEVVGEGSIVAGGGGDRWVLSPRGATVGAKLVAVNNANNAYRPATLTGSIVVFETNGETERARITSAGNLTIGGTTDSARVRVEGTTNLTTGLQLFRSGNSCGAIWQEAGAMRFGTDGSTGFTEKLRVDATTTAGQTALLLWDVDNGTLERVTVGAADSGGTGFKVLRIPN